MIKLEGKTRVRGKIHRIYDEPRTPYERLLESGLFGTYLGTRLQKFLPERWIRLILGALVTGLAAGYVDQSLI